MPQPIPTCRMCGAPEHMAHPRSNTQPRGLLPVHDPLFNLEGVCQQLVLIEQHLFDPQLQCRDCILKHFLIIEALLREIPSLDLQGLYSADALQLAGIVRQTRDNWRRNLNHAQTAQALRNIRKALVGVCLPLGGGARG